MVTYDQFIIQFSDPSILSLCNSTAAIAKGFQTMVGKKEAQDLKVLDFFSKEIEQSK